jgi:hypothetical protein
VADRERQIAQVIERETVQKNVFRVLPTRFGPVPEDLTVFPRAVQEQPKREDLHGLAVVWADLESFRRALNRPEQRPESLTRLVAGFAIIEPEGDPMGEWRKLLRKLRNGPDFEEWPGIPSGTPYSANTVAVWISVTVPLSSSNATRFVRSRPRG